MEYWNVGIMGLAELDPFYEDGKDQKIKSEQHPLLIRNIPLFHFSMGCLTASPLRVKSKPGFLARILQYKTLRFTGIVAYRNMLSDFVTYHNRPKFHSLF